MRGANARGSTTAANVVEHVLVRALVDQLGRSRQTRPSDVCEASNDENNDGDDDDGAGTDLHCFCPVIQLGSQFAELTLTSR